MNCDFPFLRRIDPSRAGVNAAAHFAGPQGDFVGLDQANLPISRSLAGRGEVDVTMMVDGKTANTVRVGIR